VVELLVEKKVVEIVLCEDLSNVTQLLEGQ